jgi:hypothetical protein
VILQGEIAMMKTTIIVFVTLLLHCAESYEFIRLINKNNWDSLRIDRVKALLEAVDKPQSAKARALVEKHINALSKIASENPRVLRMPVAGGVWRTLWSSVTSDSFVGTVLKLPPSNILGGQAWQIISNDLKEAENVVYWKRLGNTRMIGLASTRPTTLSKDQPGYDLIVKGLEFRWGPQTLGNPPEVEYGILGSYSAGYDGSGSAASGTTTKKRPEERKSILGKSWKVFSLPESATLR